MQINSWNSFIVFACLIHSYSLDLKSPLKVHVLKVGPLEVNISKVLYPYQLLNLVTCSLDLKVCAQVVGSLRGGGPNYRVSP